MEFCDNIFTIEDQPVFTYEYVDSLREKNKAKRDPYKIIAQSGGQENMLSSNVDILIGGGSRGGSKGQPYDSPVITPFGLRKIGDLKVGSIISDINGCMQKVIHITELGNRKVYKLHFSDGTNVLCTDDHLWKIKQTNTISKKRKINATGQEDDWRLWTMEMIMKYLDDPIVRQTKKGKSTNNILVPLCKPVKFTRSMSGWYKPKTDPYAIGAIIGDGCITDSQLKTGNICITSNDIEIIDEIEKSGLKPFRIYNDGKTSANDYYYRDKNLMDDIRGLKLYGCDSKSKFIPNQYKYATINDRYRLVQGLMDTDGMSDDRGHCSFSTISETLANDMAFILRSLGAYVSINKNKSGYKKNGEYIQCNDVYVLYIKIEQSDRLFNLSRKKARCKAFNAGVSTPSKRIVGYEFAGYDKCRCIAVSNPTALYMTNDFTVTHNSFSLLLEAIKDIQNKDFQATILRKEKDDVSNLETDSNRIYLDFGKYNKSQSDMTWNFYAGGFLKFNYYSDSIEDFKKRFQGKQFAFIGIDEITHIEYSKFKYLLTCNRNAFNIKNRFIGTCNPDPDSWVAKFIEWWIGEDGLPIPQRSGAVRYCFMDGDDVRSIYWGNTREEVYAQCKEIIDRYWDDSYEQYGTPQELFVKSVAFVEAKLKDNVILMSSDPNYLASLANQGDEQRARDLEGNWKYKAVGDDILKIDHIESLFKNPIQTGDNIRRASCDVALDGGDNLVMWLWIGWHVQDVFVCKMNSRQTVLSVTSKLEEWGVMEENFTYDLNGLGQMFKGFFDKAVPFNNRESVDEKYKYIYDTIKSQSAYTFAQKIIEKEISIEKSILDRKYSGKGFEKMPLRQILINERKCIRANEDSSDKGFCLIKKKDMIRVVGHSPDFFESLFMRMIFDIKKKKRNIRGLGWL